jgi:hypothetical protein
LLFLLHWDWRYVFALFCLYLFLKIEKGVIDEYFCDDLMYLIFAVIRGDSSFDDRCRFFSYFREESDAAKSVLEDVSYPPDFSNGDEAQFYTFSMEGWKTVLDVSYKIPCFSSLPISIYTYQDAWSHFLGNYVNGTNKDLENTINFGFFTSPFLFRSSDSVTEHNYFSEAIAILLSGTFRCRNEIISCKSFPEIKIQEKAETNISEESHLQDSSFSSSHLPPVTQKVQNFHAFPPIKPTGNYIKVVKEQYNATIQKMQKNQSLGDNEKLLLEELLHKIGVLNQLSEHSHGELASNLLSDSVPPIFSPSHFLFLSFLFFTASSYPSDSFMTSFDIRGSRFLMVLLSSFAKAVLGDVLFEYVMGGDPVFSLFAQDFLTKYGNKKLEVSHQTLNSEIVENSDDSQIENFDDENDQRIIPFNCFHFSHELKLSTEKFGDEKSSESLQTQQKDVSTLSLESSIFSPVSNVLQHCSCGMRFRLVGFFIW